MLLLCALWPAAARAHAVLFLASEPRAADLYAALDLELRGFGTLLVQRPAPVGFTPHAHAAAALAAAREVSAAAAVWIESAEPLRVRAVSASTERVVEAPLARPIEEIEPRVFAAVAGSVVLEALGLRAPGERQAQETSVVAPAPLPAVEQSAQGEPSPTPAVDSATHTRADLPSAPSSSLPEPYVPHSKRGAKRARFFTRIGVSLAAAYVSKGRASDRSPERVIADVARASRVEPTDPNSDIDTQTAEILLRQRGFDCAASRTAENQLRLMDCTVAVDDPGFAARFGVEGAIGLQWEQLSLALTARFTPDAGQGSLAHALLGAQLGWLLTSAHAHGLWLELVAGVGYGQIQVRPNTPTGRSAGPYVQSGPGELRGGLRGGYRFTKQLGLYAGMVVHGLLPDGLLVLDPSLGLELQL
jgi:hypothetical protein